MAFFEFIYQTKSIKFILYLWKTLIKIKIKTFQEYMT